MDHNPRNKSRPVKHRRYFLELSTLVLLAVLQQKRTLGELSREFQVRTGQFCNGAYRRAEQFWNLVNRLEKRGLVGHVSQSWPRRYCISPNGREQLRAVRRMVRCRSPIRGRRPAYADLPNVCSLVLLSLYLKPRYGNNSLLQDMFQRRSGFQLNTQTLNRALCSLAEKGFLTQIAHKNGRRTVQYRVTTLGRGALIRARHALRRY